LRSDPTDEELLVRFQRDDRIAFALLVRRHKVRLYNFVLRYLRDVSAAEEVVQDTFVRVAQGAADFRHAARFSTWLYTIARNLCVDHTRRRALRRHASLDEPERAPDGEALDRLDLGERTADVQANVERSAVSGEIRERVLAALHKLPDDQREVFLMREVSSLPFKEIADIVGAPENTVKSRMRYALEHLQEALSDFEEYARALR
jgi:RNA polymerase sigma-70 factor, ECF subfamily